MAFDAGARAQELAATWSAEQQWLAERARASAPTMRRGHLASFEADDVLATIAPAAYVEAIAGVEVSTSGTACCPLPDHDDSSPSFRAYRDPDDGWFCFGCARGGTIYDFASALWGIDTRGDAFLELRQRLARVLLGRDLT
jgi:hypothetical protein